MDRRDFLRSSALVGGAVVFGGPTLLSACGDDDNGGTSDTTATGGTGATQDLGKLSIQFSWVKNAEFAGSYIADQNGYYTDAGFSSVELLAGGPGVAAEPVVLEGKALFTYTFSEPFAGAVGEGGDLKCIGALYQQNPFCIMSLAENPINTPDDMIGKKIGVQAVNKPIWDALLRINEIDPGDLTEIPAEFDPAPVTTGEADGWFSFIINEPIDLELQGFEPVIMPLSEFGFNLHQQILVVKSETITNERDKLVAAIRATLKGWQENEKDPEVGARLAVEEYGKDLGLNLEKETKENEEQIKLMQNDVTAEYGIGYMSADAIAENVELLSSLDFAVSADLYTMEILDEVYADGIEL
jgi:ABC-type nitrate/sulfonate/bicarbonate transport system substrate-binding protein